MAKGVLIVETRPASAADAAAYHAWYEGTHLKEMTSVEGVVSARRFAALGDDGLFIAVYEIDADDVAAVQAKVREAGRAGLMSAPVGVQTDPPPRMVYCEQIAQVP